MLETIKNLAKEVIIDNSKDYFFEIKEYKANFKSNNTESLIIGNFDRDLNWLIESINVFNNIKILKLNFPYLEGDFSLKINLPLLHSLAIEDMRQIKYFIGLKFLKKIHIKKWHDINNDDGIFDPS